MTGLKTNERPGTRAVLRNSPLSAYKARQVLDLVRGRDYVAAMEVLEFCDRDAALVIGKLLHSAAANASHNEDLDPEELFVAACYADEGTTLKRWRPRARGRATRIRKRTCHITIILARLPESDLARRRAKVAAEAADRRARRVAGGRLRRRGSAAPTGESETAELATPMPEASSGELDSSPQAEVSGSTGLPQRDGLTEPGETEGSVPGETEQSGLADQARESLSTESGPGDGPRDGDHGDDTHGEER